MSRDEKVKAMIEKANDNSLAMEELAESCRKGKVVMHNRDFCTACGDTEYINLNGNPICIKCGQVVSEEEISEDIKSRFKELNNQDTSSFAFKITDKEGIHTLQSDRDCVWKCHECNSEVKVSKESIVHYGEGRPQSCPICEKPMKLHYWLDCQD